jgi:hypothetical protein
MAEKAHVTSVEALESFRASLITFLTKARPTLEESRQEVLRTRLWLESDRRVHWEAEVRRRHRRLEEARQELFSARVSSLQSESAVQQLAVQRAKVSLAEAEEKLARVKRWNREFENRTDPLTRQVDHVVGFVTTDMARAVAYLTEAIQTLEAYTDVMAPGVAAAPGLSGGERGEETLEQGE